MDLHIIKNNLSFYDVIYSGIFANLIYTYFRKYITGGIEIE